jgi:hypothetical protein
VGSVKSLILFGLQVLEKNVFQRATAGYILGYRWGNTFPTVLCAEEVQVGKVGGSGGKSTGAGASGKIGTTGPVRGGMSSKGGQGMSFLPASYPGSKGTGASTSKVSSGPGTPITPFLPTSYANGRSKGR